MPPIDAEQTAVDVTALDQEVEETAPDGAGETAAGADAGGEGGADDWLTRMEAAIGELPEQPSAELVANLTAKDLSRLGAAERGLIKHAIAQVRAEGRKQQDGLKAEQDKLAARQKELDQAAEKVLDERAKLGNLFRSKEVQEHLANAAKIDPTKLDLLTPEGQRQYLAKQSAEGVGKFFQPIMEAANRAEKESKLRDFLRNNPRMAEPAFKKRVVDLGKAREAAGQTLALADAYAIVEAQVLREAHEQQVKARQQARSVSQQHVNKTTRSGAVAEPAIPAGLERNGYAAKDGNTYRGSQATTAYFRDHPEKAKEYLRSKGR